MLLRKNGLTLLASLLLLASCATSRPAPTVVYIVRHAEKELAPGLSNPPLTAAGEQRAQALRDTLGKVPLAGIFSTNTTRTYTTAEPLATLRNQPILPYDAKQLPALAARIRRDYRGRTVLVVGHSNTILETAEALGAPRHVPTIEDDEYNYLLQVTLPADTTQAARAVARRYGAGRS